MREFLAKMALPLAVSTISTFAVAEDDEQNFVPIGIEDAKTAYQGWDDYLTLGLSGTINESKNVVGKDDGQSTTLGLKVKGGIDYGSGLSQWLNSIDILISYSRSPVIPEYIKAEDSFELDSIYKRYLESVSWLGLFVQGNVSTALFDGYHTCAEVVTYRKIGLDDEVEVIEAKRLKLTDSYNPLKIRESLGVIASPYSYKSQKAQSQLAHLIMTKEFQREFNKRKGSIPARTDVLLDGFDSCAKQSAKDFSRTANNDLLAPSFAHGNAQPSDIQEAWIEFISSFMINSMPPEMRRDRPISVLEEFE